MGRVRHRPDRDEKRVLGGKAKAQRKQEGAPWPRGCVCLRVRVRRVRTQTAYRTPALLTQQEQLDVLGGLDAVLFEVLFDLLAAGQGRPLLRRRSAPHPAGPLRAKRRAG